MREKQIPLDLESSFLMGIRLGRKEGAEMKQYIVDAFSNQPFSGNPAAVCVMDR